MRIGMLQHRHQMVHLQNVLKAGSIEMVPDEWLVFVDNKSVHLTETEYRLLQALLEAEGRVITREDLLEIVWGHKKASALESRTLDMHMSRLRHKLGSSAKAITTIRNVGYRIEIPPG